ncbi:beta-N-acetylhexosaminidase [Actinomadura parmotrematis]|uniref:beta-N-acetylhexosaminidase n=1 Tax=Actinomadura parmotrematis TaxID=2864039 RepID=A0ABS7FLS4_9ACTN|nr:beta-N-acetylhexosaminidase [Actinomadura parmotrematis]MBW8481316.1 beta-N-acetylhexosaminidase [Actinomadura parmotrematis]
MILPRPSGLAVRPGEFVLPAHLHLTAGPGAERPAALLAGYLGDRPRTASGPQIALALTGGDGDGYDLDIEPDRVVLTAGTEAGLFAGVQTLRQLLPPAALAPDAPPDAWRWPCARIQDAPRLPWRGLMIDVARHFQPLGYLHDLVDQLALHKLNVLHLHLTDDQGWRMEIDGLPRLTDVGAWRTESMIGPAGSPRHDGVPHGGFYTQAELRGLVAHAAARGVEIVPEIEMPGHARAALAAYPHLGNRPDRELPVWTGWGISEDVLGVHEEVFDFCRTVIDQVAAVFPARYLHIGGEECPTVQWERSPAARARAADLGLAAPAALHGWFLGRVAGMVAEHGRRAVCWDEADDNGDLPPAMTLTAWRDAAHGRASIARGHQVVIAPYRSTYLDYPQSDAAGEPPGQPGVVTTLADVLAFDPLAGGLPLAAGGRPGVLGTQAQLWTEFAPTPAHVRHLLYPRLCALAETAWSGPADPAEFGGRLEEHWARLRALGAVAADDGRWSPGAARAVR